MKVKEGQRLVEAMSNLADFIEQYLRGVLEQQKTIELQRRELAKQFRCAPSQINYVLETRFTLDRGFLIESKRGGGGYIRITRVQWRNSNNLPDIIDEIIPEQVSEAGSEQLLVELVQMKLVSLAEAQLTLEVIRQNFGDIPENISGYLRARFLKALLLVLGGRAKE